MKYGLKIEGVIKLVSKNKGKLETMLSTIQKWSKKSAEIVELKRAR